MVVEPARRLDLRHLGLGRDVDVDTALDQRFLFLGRLLEIDPGRAVRNFLGIRFDDRSVASGSVGAQHGGSCRMNRPALQGGSLC
jgi:hypothetical protein